MSLFSPYNLRNLRLPNRIVIAPMCTFSGMDGCTTDWHLAHFAQMLQSGVGMFITEAIAVAPEGRISPACLGLWSDATESAFGETLQRARRLAPPTAVCMQLHHAGRKASSQLPWEGGQLLPPEAGGWLPIAPSALPAEPEEPNPGEMTHADLARIRAAFADSARRADRVGIDAVELHMAHGYLAHQFLSPLSNRRTDGYGGSFAGRINFPLELFAAVRAAWPERKPLGVRISATDWADGGWTVEESIEFVRELARLGCDWVDVSSAGISPDQKIPVGPGYQVPLARALRKATGLPTIAVGLITEPMQAQAIVEAGDADLVALGRGILWNPHWAWNAAAVLGGRVEAPLPYHRAPPREAKGVFGPLRQGGR